MVREATPRGRRGVVVRLVAPRIDRGKRPSRAAYVPRGVQGGRPTTVRLDPERMVGLLLFRVIRPAPSGGRAGDVAHQPRRAGVERRRSHRTTHKRARASSARAVALGRTLPAPHALTPIGAGAELESIGSSATHFCKLPD